MLDEQLGESSAMILQTLADLPTREQLERLDDRVGSQEERFTASCEEALSALDAARHRLERGLDESILASHSDLVERFKAQVDNLVNPWMAPGAVGDDRAGKPIRAVGPRTPLEATAIEIARVLGLTHL
jgi:hypothetical protein